MKKITISDILKQYDHYRALAQMKPYGTAVKTFVNSVLKSSVEEPYLTQEIVDKWFERREKECENTHYTRTSHLKNFLQFAIDKGLTDVVIPTISSKWTPHFKSPVLMTEEEIIKFFKACDECPVNIESTGAYIDAITKRTIFGSSAFPVGRIGDLLSI